MATVATIVSVSVMIITFALTNGFQTTISHKVFSFWGHIRVQHYEPNKVAIAEELPIEKNDTVTGILRKNSEVTTVQSFATKNAILKTEESVEGVLFKGVEQDYNFNNLAGFLKSGHWLKFTDSGYSNEIVLSEYAANQLRLNVNDQVLIYFIQSNGAPPRPRKLTIAGLYRSGIDEYDKLIAFCDLKLIQRLNDWKPNEIGGYEIFLKDYKKMDAVAEKIFDELPDGWNAETIKHIYPNIFDWLNLQNQTIAIVIIIMVLVAVLNLITCLIILVLERTAMIGVLKAVGANNGAIQRIFLLQGAFITGVGIILGNVIAIILTWLQQHYGFLKLPEEAYYISTAEVKLEWWHIAVVDAGTFLVCFLALMIPTLIVRRIQPVRAISFR